MMSNSWLIDSGRTLTLGYQIWIKQNRDSFFAWIVKIKVEFWDRLRKSLIAYIDAEGHLRVYESWPCTTCLMVIHKFKDNHVWICWSRWVACRRWTTTLEICSSGIIDVLHSSADLNFTPHFCIHSSVIYDWSDSGLLEPSLRMRPCSLWFAKLFRWYFECRFSW